MGAPHFKLCFVPSGLNPVRDEEGHFEGDSLVGFPISDSIVQRLRRIFTRTRHWGDVEEYVSESEWGGELRICRNDDGHIDEIELRFAPLADPVEKLREFVAIAKDAGCYLLEMSSGTVLAPDFIIVFESLRAHHSFRFLSDPEQAVIEAARKTKQDDLRTDAGDQAGQISSH